MKCLFVHDNRYVVDGGQVYSEGQFSYRDWARYLSAFDSLTVVGRSAPPDRARERLARMNVSSGSRVDFAFLPNVAGPLELLRNRQAQVREMEGLVRDHDVVIARLPTEAGLVACAVARRLGVPYGIEVVGCPYDVLRNYGHPVAWLYAPFAAARMRATVARAPCVLYVTESFLQRRYPSGAHACTFVASNVDLPGPADGVPERRLDRLCRPTIHLKLGYCGSFANRAKGLEVTLQAVSRARNRLPPFRLSVIGPGDSEPWRHRLRELGLSDSVTLDGPLPSGQPILKWMDGLDLLIHSALQEGLPRTLIEAMSRACPIVASRIGGTDELLPDDVLHPPGDADHLANQLLAMAHDRDARIRHGLANAEKARQFHPDRLRRVRHQFFTCVAKTEYPQA